MTAEDTVFDAERLLETTAMPVGMLYQRLQAVEPILRQAKRLQRDFEASPTEQGRLALSATLRDLLVITNAAKLSAADVRAACEAIGG